VAVDGKGVAASEKKETPFFETTTDGPRRSGVVAGIKTAGASKNLVSSEIRFRMSIFPLSA